MNDSWTTADYALIISLFSASISLFALAWSVWSHFIFPKPRIRVTAHTAFFDRLRSTAVFAHANGSLPSIWAREDLEFPALALVAVNHGPGNVIFSNVVARKSKLDDRTVWGTAWLNPYNNYPSDMGTSGPHSGGLPKTLQPGEQYTAYLALQSSWFIEDKFVKVGFLDTLGRKHYCSYSDVRSLRRSVAREDKRAAV